MHTKGKWLVMGNQRHGHIDFVLPLADDKDFQDNARLIAAAPELLAACEKLVSDVDNFNDLDASIASIKQAIAKAEGEE